MGSDPESFSKSAGFSILRWRSRLLLHNFYSSANLSWIYVSSIILVLISSLLRSFVFMGSDPESFSIITKGMAAAHASKAFSINTGFISCLFFSLQKTGTHVNDGRNTFILTVNMSGSLAI